MDRGVHTAAAAWGNGFWEAALADSPRMLHGRLSHQAGSFLKEISAIVRAVCRKCSLSSGQQGEKARARQRPLCSGASVSDSAEEDLAHYYVTRPADPATLRWHSAVHVHWVGETSVVGGLLRPRARLVASPGNSLRYSSRCFQALCSICDNGVMEIVDNSEAARVGEFVFGTGRML